MYSTYPKKKEQERKDNQLMYNTDDLINTFKHDLILIISIDSHPINDLIRCLSAGLFTQ